MYFPNYNGDPSMLASTVTTFLPPGQYSEIQHLGGVQVLYSIIYSWKCWKCWISSMQVNFDLNKCWKVQQDYEGRNGLNAEFYLWFWSDFLELFWHFGAHFEDQVSKFGRLFTKVSPNCSSKLSSNFSSIFQRTFHRTFI